MVHRGNGVQVGRCDVVFRCRGCHSRYAFNWFGVWYAIHGLKYIHSSCTLTQTKSMSVSDCVTRCLRCFVSFPLTLHSFDKCSRLHCRLNAIMQSQRAVEYNNLIWFDKRERRHLKLCFGKNLLLPVPLPLTFADTYTVSLTFAPPVNTFAVHTNTSSRAPECQPKQNSSAFLPVSLLHLFVASYFN